MLQTHRHFVLKNQENFFETSTFEFEDRGLYYILSKKVHRWIAHQADTKIWVNPTYEEMRNYRWMGRCRLCSVGKKRHKKIDLVRSSFPHPLDSKRILQVYYKYRPDKTFITYKTFITSITFFIWPEYLRLSSLFSPFNKFVNISISIGNNKHHRVGTYVFKSLLHDHLFINNK